MIYKIFDVVVVPFPFTDKLRAKRRPALVISSEKSFNTPSGYTVLAMITSAQHVPWPLDVKITDLEAAGLAVACCVRMKLFTIDNHLIIKNIGKLSAVNRKQAQLALKKLLEK